MFVAQTDVGYFGGTQIVAGNVAMATGVALAAQLEQADRVAVTFVGDGGVNQGVFHEAVNLAAVWRLPVIVVIENNGYAQTTSTSYASAGVLQERGAAYGIASVSVDGQSAVDMYEAAATARERAVAGEGPTIIEARTYRYEGHYYGDRHRAYRTQTEVDSWLERDPVALHRHLIHELGLDEAELDAIPAEAARLSHAAFERARKGAPVNERDLLDDITIGDFTTNPVTFGGAL
jgi:TPP-dependent pyruvate/acetoin dehydrogenase alpha subunit